MELLEGTEEIDEEEKKRWEKEKVEREKTESTEEMIDKGKELEEEEIVEAVKKMKLGKVAGIDGIPFEAWRYGEMAIREGLIKI